MNIILNLITAAIGAALKPASKAFRGPHLRLIAASRNQETAATGQRATGQCVFMTKSSGKNSNQEGLLMS